MTKEELIEMVNATINENGTRSITGKALNLALTEIINAMGTGSGGQGGLVIYFASGNETIEQKAHNAEVYSQCKVIAENNGTLPSITINMNYQGESLGVVGLAMSAQASVAMFDSSGTMVGTPGLFIQIADISNNAMLVVNEDGTTMYSIS